MGWVLTCRVGGGALQQRHPIVVLRHERVGLLHRLHVRHACTKEKHFNSQDSLGVSTQASNYIAVLLH